MVETNETKADVAFELIKNKILMLEFLPGQPLREIELSQMLSMSRTPIKGAIERLIYEGFVEEIGPKRNVVSEVSVESFMDIHRIREVLESLSVSLATYAWNRPEQIQNIRETVDRQLKLSEQHPLASRIIQDTDRTFHRMLAELSGNGLLVRESARIYDLYWRYIFYSMHKNYSSKIAHEHKDILDAIEQRNSSLAQEYLRAHLNIVKEEILVGLAKGFNPAVELQGALEGYSFLEKTKQNGDTL